MLNYQIVPGRQARQKEYQDNPVGYEQKTVSSSAVGFASIPPDANKAVVVVENANIRWRDDGTDPTSSVGTKSYVNTTITINGRDRISAFRAIRLSTTDAKLSINYYDRK